MDTTYDPSNKGHILAVHVLHRGWDAGSILGAALVCPIVAYRLRTRSPIVQPLLKALGVSACTGTVLAGVLGLGRVYQEGLDKKAIEERVLKLHKNASQNHVDLYSGAGAGLGAVTAAAATGLRLWPVLGGAAAGCAAGILAHMAVPAPWAAEQPPASAPSKAAVTLSDAWFNNLWKLCGPRTDKLFAEPKAKLFGSTPLAGSVLEIGPGHGSTLPYVSGAIQGGSIRSITFFEPNQAMHAELRAAAVKAGLTEGGAAPGFTITASAAGLPPAAYDAVVSSLVLCSVDDVHESAADLYRWLRPGGTLLFLEHVADGQQTRALHVCNKHAPGDPDPALSAPPGRSWRLWFQQTLTPGWKVIGGGCHLDRPTVDALEAAFDSVHVLGVVDSQLIPVVYGTAHKK